MAKTKKLEEVKKPMQGPQKVLDALVKDIQDYMVSTVDSKTRPQIDSIVIEKINEYFGETYESIASVIQRTPGFYNENRKKPIRRPKDSYFNYRKNKRAASAASMSNTSAQ